MQAKSAGEAEGRKRGKLGRPEASVRRNRKSGKTEKNQKKVEKKIDPKRENATILAP